MSWTPLSRRLPFLPLILAGPILRRTEPDGVTVWVALKKPSQVTLSVYPTNDSKDFILNQPILEGGRSTFPLGQHLHVVAVTAKPVTAARLKPGQIYAYNLNFSDHKGGLIKALTSDIYPENIPISYFDHQLPTFVMPPDDLNHLRIVHGSCRKPHGGGRDALPILDDLIAQNASLPNSRPHQLFFTGDQIYGDDVADPLLWAVTDAGNALLGWEEDLPLHDVGSQQDNQNRRSIKPTQLKPGQRSDIAKDYAGLTAMLVNHPQKAKSHLFSLGEYSTMYLFVWSQVLWPASFPLAQEMRLDAKQAKVWEEEVYLLEGFGRDLWKVRRLLANIPTYMIFDDHDVSDDWYLNREWCNRVLSKPLGRRTVQNALLAYAVFQAWGNTPDQFRSGQAGDMLLQAAQNWSASGGTDKFAWMQIGKYLGIPSREPETQLPQFALDREVLVLDRHDLDGTRTIDWHYSVRASKHEAIVMDTRTWRGYPKGCDRAMSPPMLLSPTAFKKQIGQSLEATEASSIEATLVILPTNLVHLSAIDLVQRLHLEQGKVFGSDVGDSWNLHDEAFTQLLAELFKRRDRAIILSGDIHYACAVRLSYWFRSHFGEAKLNPDTPEKPKVLAQLTASAFKNEEWKTNIAHTKIKSIFPEPTQDWLGWNERPQLIEIQATQEKVRVIDIELPDQKPILRPVQTTRGSDEIVWQIAIKDRESLPDWRYHVEWIKREKAQPVWADLPSLPQDKKRTSSHNAATNKQWGNLAALFWQNQWLQEGDEVVGHNNFGLISFKWPSNDSEKAVIQDVYWRPTWQPSSVVFSRYSVPLQLDAPPPLPTVILP